MNSSHLENINGNELFKVWAEQFTAQILNITYGAKLAKLILENDKSSIMSEKIGTKCTRAGLPQIIGMNSQIYEGSRWGMDIINFL